MSTRARSASEPAPPSPALLDQLLNGLGSKQYAVREDATRRIFALGPSVSPRLRERLNQTSDPEVQHRLRYLLANIAPPKQAVLLIRASAGAGLEPGAVITHVGAARVHNQSELRQMLARPSRQMTLRVYQRTGPRTVGPLGMEQLVELSDYVSPRGETLAEVVRLYATGFAERAYDKLRGLGAEVPENELSRPLRAMIAYTAGDGARATALMEGQAGGVRATEGDWGSPSFLDLRGPVKAPFHIEWVLASGAGRESFSSQADPDLRIQRILLPARRFADALIRTVGYWRREYRDTLGQGDETALIAGNQLAVAAWMLHGLNLRSECCRLIEPRSVILRRPRSDIRKWIRVETDAWLPLLAGDARAALDGFYDDAFDVLQRPPGYRDRYALIRNPSVAARLAFFLYQFPNDPRVGRTLEVVNHDQYPVLADYLHWMMYALREGNYEAIKRDVYATLPRVSDEDVGPGALAAALLEYVSAKPSPDVIRAARARMLAAPRGVDADVRLAVIDALLQLADGRPLEALHTLQPLEDRPETAALRHTAKFLANPPATTADHSTLADVILAVPLGTTGEQWIVLARDRRLMRFDAKNSLLTALDRPTPTWFPNPLTWPWIGREERTGRVWVYCRRRVIELAPNEGREPLRLNINTNDISAFARFVGPHFGALAEAASASDHSRAENGEFLRGDLKANREYVADPDLREIGFIRPTPNAERVIHVALRGGPQMLIDASDGRSWTSQWIASRLGLSEPRRLFVHAATGACADAGETLILMSDQGLIRFETNSESLTRITLPGDRPYPPLIPESTPYQRRDPRWVYCARLPEDGGGVYRVSAADWSVEPVDMVNEALPEHFYDAMLRSEIRAVVDRRLAGEGLPSLAEFITDAIDTVARWRQAPPATP